MLRQWNKSVPAGLENMLIWRLNQMTIIHLIGDWAISKSWAQFKICHCTVKACFWLKYINYSSSWSKTLTTIPSKALWHSPDLEEPARPPLLSRPLGHLWNPHWSAGICQIELLAPGIFGTWGLPEGKLCIGLSTRLCSKSGRTFEKGWWERRIRKLTLSHWWNQDDRQAVSVIFCVWSYPDTWYLISVSHERMIWWKAVRPTPYLQESRWQFGFLWSHNCCSSHNSLPLIPGNNDFLRTLWFSSKLVAGQFPHGLSELWTLYLAPPLALRWVARAVEASEPVLGWPASLDPWSLIFGWPSSLDPWQKLFPFPGLRVDPWKYSIMKAIFTDNLCLTIAPIRAR